MALTGAVAAVAIGATAYSINEGKKAREAQSAALSRQENRQTQLENERKKKEAQAMQQAFMTNAATQGRRPFGANMPGAAPAKAIGSVSNPLQASKKLIGG